MKEILIRMDWGSEFQENTGEGALNAILEAWKAFYEGTHKNNKITIEEL